MTSCIKRLFKCAMHHLWQEYAMHLIAEKISGGAELETICLESSVNHLRKKTCEWLFKAHMQASKQKEMIRARWVKIGIDTTWLKETQNAAIDRNMSKSLFLEDAKWEVKEEQTSLTCTDWFGDCTIDQLFDLSNPHDMDEPDTQVLDEGSPNTLLNFVGRSYKRVHGVGLHSTKVAQVKIIRFFGFMSCVRDLKVTTW